ncbi:hypothetical protein C4D60_Mb09t09510 [Musa balbisiana]|uniref:Uncharacterized protein n=1 Tax=Musa balbisiana TaxID=52838 RepID=A0A4S8IHM1_MUSBA|nr:hypothetical protein C4D60_Mb09t09510 [Musa balbisiana]
MNTKTVRPSLRDNKKTVSLQLSPCDSRLSLSSRGAQLAVFRPKVDEISLLTVNTATNPSGRSIPPFLSPLF